MTSISEHTGLSLGFTKTAFTIKSQFKGKHCGRITAEIIPCQFLKLRNGSAVDKNENWSPFTVEPLIKFHVGKAGVRKKTTDVSF